MNGKLGGDESLGDRTAGQPVNGTFRDLLGCVRPPDVQPLTVDEMDEAISEFLASDNKRIREGRA
jgi:hypothetical protein